MKSIRLQEAKVLNGRLVVYLKKPSTLRRLLEYLIGRPPVQKSVQRDAAGKAPETRTKHSMVACEVLCNLAEGLPGAIAGSNDMLELLFSAAGTSHTSLCGFASCARASLIQSHFHIRTQRTL